MKTGFDFSNSLKRCLRIYVFFIIGLLLIGLLGCSETAPPQRQVSEGEPTTPSSINTSTVEVDLLYFHRPQRCIKCLCFERRVSDVVSECFQDEINNGQLTFRILDIGNKENYALVQKYGIVGSQLFINTKINGEEHIKDIQEIWTWDCTSNTNRFYIEVKNIISSSLAGEQ